MSDFDWYRLFKTLHVLAVAMLAGGITIEMVLGPIMPKVSTVGELRVLSRIMATAENFIIIPAAVLLIIFGYLTADRAGYDLGDTWLLLGQILTYAALAASMLVLRSAAVRLEKAVQAAPEGPVTEELRREVSNPLPAIVGTSLTVIFVIIVYLMVAKPGW